MKKKMAMKSLEKLEHALFSFLYENIHSIHSNPLIAVQYGAVEKTHTIVSRFNHDHFLGEVVTEEEIGTVLGAIVACAAFKVPCAVEWLTEAKAVAAA